MTPTTVIETTWTTALATSTTAGLSIALKQVGVIVPFTPGEDLSSLDSGDILPTSAGLGISYTAATRQAARNPVTGAYMVNVPPPAGGNEELSGSGGSYPVTLYGTLLLKTPFAAPGDIIGSEAFDTPVTITGASQLIEYNEAAFSFNVGAWF